MGGRTSVLEARSYPAWLITGAVFALLMAFVGFVPIGGDTTAFAQDIEALLRAGYAAPRLWDFSHLLWRPLGMLLEKAFLPSLLPHFNHNPTMAVSFLLMCPSLACGLICGLVVLSAVQKLTLSPGVATLAACAFLCLNVMLNYSRLGTPYICGLACSSLAFYCAAFLPGTSWGVAALSGGLAGIAALLWIPYVVSIPGILLARQILNLRDEARAVRLRLALVTGTTAVLTIAAFYALAFGTLHLGTADSVVAWVHGTIPSSRRLNILHIVTGLPRSFYEMGDDAVWLKWFLYRDPYAAVRFWDVVERAVARLAVFWGCMAALAALLWSSATGRRILLLLAVFSIPHLALAAMTEGASAERYAALLPIVFLGFGCAMADTSLSHAKRVLATLLCCSHIIPNAIAGRERNMGHVVRQDPVRLAAFANAPQRDAFFVLNGRDGFWRLTYLDPLNPLNRNPLPAVLMLGASQKEVACRVLDVWNHGGDAWISLRVLAARPERKWLWVDGDDGTTWADLHEFFTPLENDDRAGGSDGFFRLPNTPGSAVRVNCPNVH